MSKPSLCLENVSWLDLEARTHGFEDALGPWIELVSPTDDEDVLTQEQSL